MKSTRKFCVLVFSISILLCIQCFSDDLQIGKKEDSANILQEQGYKGDGLLTSRKISLENSSSESEFLEKEIKKNKRSDEEMVESNQNQQRSYNFQNVQVEEGSAASGVLTIIIVGALLGGLFFAYKFWKNRKQKSSGSSQGKNDRLRFIPRVSIPADVVFSESSSGLNGLFSKKKSGGQQFNPSGRILSPSNKNAPTLKLEEEVHHSSAINENIFTNIDNSPRSSGEQSPTTSVRNTPKDINFNIEFSMLEQDSRIKSARDQD